MKGWDDDDVGDDYDDVDDDDDDYDDVDDDGDDYDELAARSESVF